VKVWSAERGIPFVLVAEGARACQGLRKKGRRRRWTVLIGQGRKQPTGERRMKVLQEEKRLRQC